MFYKAHCYCGITYLCDKTQPSLPQIREHHNSNEHKETLIKNPVKNHTYVCPKKHQTQINQRKGYEFKEPEKCCVCKSTELVFVPELSRFLD